MLGRSIGISESKFQHLGDDPLPDGVYSEAEAAIVRYAQRSTKTQRIADATYQALAEHFSVEQMIDPWPRNVGNRNIAFNGEKMQSAVERYRTNKVIPPVNATTSSVAYQQAQQAAQSNANNTQTMSAPAAPVR